MDEGTHGRKKGGRPRKDRVERRDSYIGFWVTDDEKAAILARASAAGITAVSSFARAAVLNAPVRTARAPQHSPELVAQLRRLGNNVNQCLKEARVGNFPPTVAEAAEDALKEVSAALRAQIHAPEY